MTSAPGPLTTVYAIGRNYTAHVRELGNALPAEPVVFLKAPRSVRGLHGPLAFADEELHHEVELVVHIGVDVPRGADVGWEVVDALTLGLDLTRRPVQARLKERGLPWALSKSFEGSAVLGGFLGRDELGDPEALELALSVDGTERQRGRVADMTWSVPELLCFLARHAPLGPGDIVFTGTPAGVGPIARGAGFRMELTGPLGTRTFSGIL